MSLHYVPEITDGVLLSRVGEVHCDTGRRSTACGQTFLPGRVATVSHVQAIVHKLRLCSACYPHHHGPGGRYAKR